LGSVVVVEEVTGGLYDGDGDSGGGPSSLASGLAAGAVLTGSGGGMATVSPDSRSMTTVLGST